MAFRTGLLGKKIGITSIFTNTGDRAPVTAVHAGPCVVLDKMTPDKHGYAAVKLGFGEKPLRRTTKPELGLFTKANVPPQRFVREVRLEAADLERTPGKAGAASTDRRQMSEPHLPVIHVCRMSRASDASSVVNRRRPTRIPSA